MKGSKWEKKSSLLWDHHGKKEKYSIRVSAKGVGLNQPAGCIGGHRHPRLGDDDTSALQPTKQDAGGARGRGEGRQGTGKTVCSG